jgi:hypothetical protein
MCKVRFAINTYMNADPWFHGTWAKECNHLYLFSRKNVIQNYFTLSRLMKKIARADDMGGCKVFLRAN